MKIPTRSRITPLWIILLLVSGAAGAADYPRGDHHLLLEFDRYTNKLDARDKTPRVRLYGSGRLVIYYPAYMRKAGIYEGFLSETEVEMLVSQLQAIGVQQLTSEMIAAETTLASTQEETLSGTLYYRSERLTTHLVLDLTDDGSTAESLQVANLQPDAKRLKSKTLVDLAGVETTLLALADRSDWVRVADPAELTP